MTRAFSLAGVRVGVRNSKLENDLKHLWWFWEVRFTCEVHMTGERPLEAYGKHEKERRWPLEAKTGHGW